MEGTLEGSYQGSIPMPECRQSKKRCSDSCAKVSLISPHSFSFSFGDSYRGLTTVTRAPITIDRRTRGIYPIRKSPKRVGALSFWEGGDDIADQESSYGTNICTSDLQATLIADRSMAYITDVVDGI